MDPACFSLSSLCPANKIHYQQSACLCVLHLGPLPTHYSTIWLDMDPAHTTKPLALLGLVKTHLQHHEAILASTAADVRQAAVNQEQGFIMLAAQIRQLTIILAVSPDPPPPAPTQHGPVPEPRVGVPERCAGDAVG